VKLHSIILLIIASVMLLPGCGSSQALVKRGDKMKAAGMHKDAADFYFQALSKNRNNVKARIGLSESGQRTLNDYLDRFNRTNNLGNSYDAVYQFIEAQEYQSKLKRVGVETSIPDHYHQSYATSKDKVLTDLYAEGNRLLEEKKFDLAEAKFKEVKKLDPTYKDAKDLSAMAYSEPLYIEGKVALENGAYRMAYDKFDLILKRSDNYKDTRELQLEALEKGRYTVAVVSFENVSGTPDVEKRISAYILDDLSTIKDPFLRIVDRDNIEKILEEQRFSLSGMVNEQTATRVGELIGAKALITGKLLDYRVTTGRITSTKKNGYEGYQVRRTNPDTGAEYFETQYKRVTYDEFSGSSSVHLSFQYKMLSLETGEVLFSRIVEREARDDVNFANYDGNTALLFPANGNVRNTSSAAKNQLERQLKAPRNLKSTTELSNSIFNTISKQVSNEVANQIKR
jgi:hypothetical protein